MSRTEDERGAPWWAGLPVATLLVFAAALLPRLSGLADFLTTDEAYHWITRTERFAAAVAEGRWADTNLTGHPGVTLMWLGGLGLRLEQLAVGMGWAAAPDRLGHLAWLRLGPALANSLLITLGYRLLRRLLRPPVALLAALLWATSPYLVAHGRLLHLDALLTGFVTLALLAAISATQTARPLPWIAAGGLLTGLALLTKGPALIALPAIGIALFVGRVFEGGLRQYGGGLGDGRGGRSTLRPFDGGLGDRDEPPASASAGEGHAPRPTPDLRALVRALIWSLSRYAVWLAVAALTVWLLWPALWVAPQAALGRYVEEIIGNGGRPNGDGQFFLGRAAADPGPLFYLVAGLYRLTPLELLGLLGLPLLALQSGGAAERRSGGAAERPSGGAAERRSGRAAERGSGGAGERRSGILHVACCMLRSERTLLILGGFIVFWTLVMTLGPKKFDRYTLPTWPALLVLSAVGLDALYERVRQKVKGKSRNTTKARPFTFYLLPFAFTILLQGMILLWYHPYHLSYYSPLLGGGPVAQRTFLIGWGEGMDQVGAWLSAQPDIGGGQVLSALAPTLQPFVPVPVQAVRAIDTVSANYAVVYLESVQRGDAPEIYERIRETVPLHTVRIHGIEYAWVHQLARPYQTPVGAQFGDGLRLRGVSAEQQGGRLIVTPSWDVRGPIGGDHQLFLHLYDAAGAKVAQIDVAPGGASVPPTGQWRPGAQIAVPLPIDLPPGLPPGAYRMALGLYDPTTFARLPLTAGPAFDPALAGADAAFLGSVTLR